MGEKFEKDSIQAKKAPKITMNKLEIASKKRPEASGAIMKKVKKFDVEWDAKKELVGKLAGAIGTPYPGYKNVLEQGKEKFEKDSTQAKKAPEATLQKLADAAEKRPEASNALLKRMTKLDVPFKKKKDLMAKLADNVGSEYFGKKKVLKQGTDKFKLGSKKMKKSPRQLLKTVNKVVMTNGKSGRAPELLKRVKHADIPWKDKKKMVKK